HTRFSRDWSSDVCSSDLTYAQNLPDSVVEGDQGFDMEVLATDLAGPWEISWGPDGWLWVTERIAGRITRIDPADGTKATAIEFRSEERRVGKGCRARWAG